MNKVYENKKSSHLVELSHTQFSKNQRLKSDLMRVRKLSDKDITANVAKDTDVAPLLIQWPKDVHVVVPIV